MRRVMLINWVLPSKILWQCFASSNYYRRVCLCFSAVLCPMQCVLLTELAAVSKCLELSTVTHTSLMTPATIKATTIFWGQSEQAPVIWVPSSLSLFTPITFSPRRQCNYLRRHLSLCSCAEYCVRRHPLTTVACTSLKNKKSHAQNKKSDELLL